MPKYNVAERYLTKRPKKVDDFSRGPRGLVGNSNANANTKSLPIIDEEDKERRGA